MSPSVRIIKTLPPTDSVLSEITGKNRRAFSSPPSARKVASKYARSFEFVCAASGIRTLCLLTITRWSMTAIEPGRHSNPRPSALIIAINSILESRKSINQKVLIPAYICDTVIYLLDVYKIKYQIYNNNFCICFC